MSKLIGELLFRTVWILVEDLIAAIFWRTCRKLLVWLGTKFKGRAAIVVGGLLGLAAYGLPIAFLLWAH